MTAYVLDSFAWIGYLNGAETATRVRELLASPAEVYTPSLVVAEVTSKVLRRGKDASIAWEALRSSVIVPLDAETARAAGALHMEYRKRISDFALADAVVLATARRLNARIVTGDPHFRGVRGVDFLA